MELLKTYQLDLMLVLSGVCMVIALFACFTNALNRRRKNSLILLEIGSAILLLSDRLAYIYRGDTSTLGYYMVRITNFTVFFMTLVIMHGFNVYVTDLCEVDAAADKTSKRLKFANYLYLFGVIMVFISQFTGFYYYFDEANHYIRGKGFLICYIIPIIILMLDLSVILKYRKKISKRILVSIILFTIVPLIASILQISAYGLSLTNISIVGLAINLYLNTLLDLNKKVNEAQRKEIEFLQNEQLKMQQLFEETAKSLASAIDAKDRYTRGHSDRVARYARTISSIAGKSKKECDEVYFSALLHDVGKIGLPDHIINKEGKLTDEEYEIIKSHPVIGDQILSNIDDFPYIRTGARWHHERYDGKGYPDQLEGEDIPELARIIAVADSYDAMASNRSYRSYLPQEKVREELLKGKGTQFDPKYAQIMIDLIDRDKAYQMREH